MILIRSDKLTAFFLVANSFSSSSSSLIFSTSALRPNITPRLLQPVERRPEDRSRRLPDLVRCPAFLLVAVRLELPLIPPLPPPPPAATPTILAVGAGYLQDASPWLHRPPGRESERGIRSRGGRARPYTPRPSRDRPASSRLRNAESHIAAQYHPPSDVVSPTTTTEER